MHKKSEIPVSPYRSTRNEVRNLVGSRSFIEVYVDTTLEECERRDPKGMYARARNGEIQNFTGVDDPYEPPTSPEIILNTMEQSAEENARAVIYLLKDRGFLM